MYTSYSPLLPISSLGVLSESPDETSLIQEALARGSRDVNEITNSVFFARHKERRSQRLDPKEPGFKQLSEEWRNIRDTLVLPALEKPHQSPAVTRPSSPDCNLPLWLLEYENAPGNARCISLSDPEFIGNYVDWNILNSTATVNIEEGKILEWKVFYKGGRTKFVDTVEVPVLAGGPRTGVSASLISRYVRKADGFIYPVFNGRIRYDWVQTPNLIGMRYELDIKLKTLRKLRLLIFLAGAFSSAIATNARGIASSQTIKLMNTNLTNLQMLEQLSK